MTVNCIVIDDEEIARKGIEKYISRISFLQLAGSFVAAMDAVPAIKTNEPVLLLLDIRMRGMNGLDFLRSLSLPPLTIITSAYPDYAIEGFSLDVIDYLVKPFSFERFLKACNKAKDYLELKDRSIHQDRYFFVKANNKIEKIEMDKILFVEALENYVNIYTPTQKYLTLVSLKTIEELLAGKGFLRVQKSYVVSLSKIDGLDGDELTIASYKIPIGRKFKEKVVKQVLKNKLLKRG
jgi:two-component system, LytTR family, response regulator